MKRGGRRSEAAAGCRFTPKGVSRRRFLTTGLAADLLGRSVGAGGTALLSSHPRVLPSGSQRGRAALPPVGGLHLQFGRNAAPKWWCPGIPRTPSAIRESCWARQPLASAASWQPRRSAPGLRSQYRGALVNHAHLANPDAIPTTSTPPRCTTVQLRSSGPHGPPSGRRKPPRFTSFGDQSTPALN